MGPGPLQLDHPPPWGSYTSTTGGGGGGYLGGVFGGDANLQDVFTLDKLNPDALDFGWVLVYPREPRRGSQFLVFLDIFSHLSPHTRAQPGTADTGPGGRRVTQALSGRAHPGWWCGAGGHLMAEQDGELQDRTDREAMAGPQGWAPAAEHRRERAVSLFLF